MTAINAASSTPVYTPMTDQAAVTTDKPSIPQIQHQALTPTLAKMLDGTFAELPLPAPETDAVTPASVKAATVHLLSLVPEDVSVDIYFVMALFQKIAQEARNGARIDREALTQAEVKSLQTEAQYMRDSASSTFKAAVIQGAMQIAGGVAQVGLSAAALQQSATSVSQEGAGDLAGAKLSTANATAYTGYSQASGGIATGIGGIAGAVHAKDAADSDASRAEQAAVTKVAETGVQQANEYLQAMLEAIKDTRDKLQSIQQSSTETNRTINRNI